MNVFLWSNFLESNLHNFNLCLIAIAMLNVQMWYSALCLQSVSAHGCWEYGQSLSLSKARDGYTGDCRGEIIIAGALSYISTFTA